MYIEKHKFMGFTKNWTAGGTQGIWFELVRHFENEYKLPIIDKIKSQPCRAFKEKAHSSTHNSNRYGIIIPDLKTYTSIKSKLEVVIKQSADMASQENWKKRLNIKYGKGTISSTITNLKYKNTENPKFIDACKKYLDPDYTYEVS